MGWYDGGGMMGWYDGGGAVRECFINTTECIVFHGGISFLTLHTCRMACS